MAAVFNRKFIFSVFRIFKILFTGVILQGVCFANYTNA